MYQTKYIFEAKLGDIDKEITRTFKVNSNVKFMDLAIYTMLLFRINGTHLFSVMHYPENSLDLEEISNVIDNPHEYFHYLYEYKPVDESWKFEESANNNLEERKNPNILLKDAIKRIDEFLIINYDFGDDWKFVCKLINIEENENLSKPFELLDAKGYGIIEDIGGAFGLEEYMNMAKKGKHASELKEYRRWLKSFLWFPKDFKIDDFDGTQGFIESLQKIDDKDISKIKKYFKEMYEID